MALAASTQKDARLQVIVALGLIALAVATIAVAYYIVGVGL